jgi:hypothetical protein
MGKWGFGARGALSLSILVWMGSARAGDYIVACSQIPHPEEINRLDRSGYVQPASGYTLDTMHDNGQGSLILALVRRVSFYRDSGNLKELSSSSHIIQYAQLTGQDTPELLDLQGDGLHLRVEQPTLPTSKGHMSSFDDANMGEVEVICHPCPNLTDRDHEPINLGWFQRRVPGGRFGGAREPDAWAACGRKHEN